MLQFVAVASHPLHVEELAQYLAFDFTSLPIPKFHDVRRWRVDGVLSSCFNSLSVVEVDGSSVIQFLHPSVKGYMTLHPPFIMFFKTPLIPAPHKPVWAFCCPWMTTSPETASRSFLSLNMLQSIGLTIPDLRIFSKTWKKD